jgi:aryl-alcohol dehydrogenase-like predicted oxidoreductase
VIEEGYAFYWGTSNWDADKIFEAFQVCEKYNLHKPIAGQNQYNMINRKEIEDEYRTLFDKYHYGLVAFSPLLGGYLTGKYIDQPNSEGRFTAESISGVPK